MFGNRQRNGVRSRMSARSVFTPDQPQSGPKYVPQAEADDYMDYDEPEPVVMVPNKKKTSDLPGFKLLRQLERQRVRDSIDAKLKELSIQ